MISRPFAAANFVSSELIQLSKFNDPGSLASSSPAALPPLSCNQIRHFRRPACPKFDRAGRHFLFLFWRIDPEAAHSDMRLRTFRMCQVQESLACTCLDGEAKMNKKLIWILLAAGLAGTGCGQANTDPKAEAPPPAQVEHEQDGSVVQVDHPEQIPLVTAVARSSRPELVVTGVVAPDISRNVPVVSLASGRVVEIRCAPGRYGAKGPVAAECSQLRRFRRLFGLPQGRRRRGTRAHAIRTREGS